MAIGYFLRLGDRTTCGGTILSGDPAFTIDGVATARMGEVVSCGRHPGQYAILGGVKDMWNEGQAMPVHWIA